MDDKVVSFKDPIKRVQAKIDQLEHALGLTKEEWTEQERAFKELADAFIKIAGHEHTRMMVEKLVPKADEIGKFFTNLRSQLASHCSRSIASIARALERDFTMLADALLPSIAATAKASTDAIRGPGAGLFNDVSQFSRYNLKTFCSIYYKPNQGERVRMLLLEQISVVLLYWNKHEVEPAYQDLVAVIARGMEDPSQKVRKVARDTFCNFSTRWQERLHELVDLPKGKVREVLITEKPHADIVKTILTKYPDAGPKNKKKALTTSESIAQRRTLYKKTSSLLTQPGDDIEIHVSTPPPKPRVAAQPPQPPVMNEPAQHSTDNAQADEKSSERLQVADLHAQPPAASERPVDNIKMTLDFSESLIQTIAHPQQAGVKETEHGASGFHRSRIEELAQGSKIPLAMSRSPSFRGNQTLNTEATRHSTNTAPASSIPRLKTSASFSLSGILRERPLSTHASTENLMQHKAMPTPELRTNVTLRARRRPGSASSSESTSSTDERHVPADHPVATHRTAPDEALTDEEPSPPTATLVSMLPRFDALVGHESEEEKQEEATMMVPDDTILDSTEDEIEETMLIPRKESEIKTLQQVQSQLHEVQSRFAELQNVNQILFHKPTVTESKSMTMETSRRSFVKTDPVAAQLDLHRELRVSFSQKERKANGRLNVEESSAPVPPTQAAPPQQRSPVRRRSQYRLPTEETTTTVRGRRKSIAEEVDRVLQDMKQSAVQEEAPTLSIPFTEVDKSEILQEMQTWEENPTTPVLQRRAEVRKTAEEEKTNNPFFQPEPPTAPAPASMELPSPLAIHHAVAPEQILRPAALSSTRRLNEELAAASRPSLNSMREARISQEKQASISSSWKNTIALSCSLALGFVFCTSGLLHAAATIRDSHAFHRSLLTRIEQFESSIAESYDAVKKLEQNYQVWNEYVRVLAEEDELNAITHLETVQADVERWQRDMQHDLQQFKQTLVKDVAAALKNQQNQTAEA